MRKWILIVSGAVLAAAVCTAAVFMTQAGNGVQASREAVSDAKSCVFEAGDQSVTLTKEQLRTLKPIILKSWHYDLLNRSQGEPACYLIFNNTTLGLLKKGGSTYIKIMDFAGRYYRTDGDVYDQVTALFAQQTSNEAETYQVAPLSAAEKQELWERQLWFAHLELPTFSNPAEAYADQLLQYLYDYLLCYEDDAITYKIEKGEELEVSAYLRKDRTDELLQELFNLPALPDDGTQVVAKDEHGRDAYLLKDPYLPEYRRSKAQPTNATDGDFRLQEVRYLGSQYVAVAEQYGSNSAKPDYLDYFVLMKREDGSYYLSRLERAWSQPDNVTVAGGYQSLGSSLGGMDFYDVTGASAVEMGNSLFTAVEDGYRIHMVKVSVFDGTQVQSSLNLQEGETLLRIRRRGGCMALLTNQRIILVDSMLQINQMIQLPTTIAGGYDLADDLRRMAFIDEEGLQLLDLTTEERTLVYKHPYLYQEDSATAAPVLNHPLFVDGGSLLLCEQESVGRREGFWLFDPAGETEEQYFEFRQSVSDVVVKGDGLVAVINKDNGEGKLLNFRNRNILGFSCGFGSILPETAQLSGETMLFFSQVGNGMVLHKLRLDGDGVSEQKTCDFGVMNAQVKMFGITESGRALCGYGNLGKYEILLTN